MCRCTSWTYFNSVFTTAVYGRYFYSLHFTPGGTERVRKFPRITQEWAGRNANPDYSILPCVKEKGQSISEFRAAAWRTAAECVWVAPDLYGTPTTRKMFLVNVVTLVMLTIMSHPAMTLVILPLCRSFHVKNTFKTVGHYLGRYFVPFFFCGLRCVLSPHCYRQQTTGKKGVIFLKSCEDPPVDLVTWKSYCTSF